MICVCEAVASCRNLQTPKTQEATVVLINGCVITQNQSNLLSNDLIFVTHSE